MSKYDFSSDGLLSLLPTSLRRPRLIGLMRRLLVPVSFMHAAFMSYKEKKEYRLSHTGQVFSLTQVVCDFCDNSGCYITDGSYIDEVMLPYSGEGELINHQVGLPYDSSVTPALMVPWEGFGHTGQADFIVHLPAELAGGRINLAALRQLIDEYKLAGKFYNIVFDGVEPDIYSFGWSDGVCQQVKANYNEYNFKWSQPVCEQTGAFSFAWSGAVCVLEGAYSFAWSDAVCAQIFTNEV